MFNKTNLFGWANLILRILLGLGLVVVVQYCYGSGNVKAWILYITLTAAINAVDGLLSQYFMREFLRAGTDADQLRKCYSHQRGVYLVLAMGCTLAAYFALSGEMRLPMTVLLGGFAYFKTNESRARAHLSPFNLQKLEVQLQGVLAFLVIIASMWAQNYEWFVMVHIVGSMLGLAVKGIRARQAQSLRFLQENKIPARSAFEYSGLVQSAFIAFGGSLSVNLGLLALNAATGNQLEAAYLLSYRIGALICEMASLPLIVRMPEITMRLAGQLHEEALSLFRTNYRQSLLICLVLFATLNVASPFWNLWMPAGLRIEGGILLLLISVGWLLERVATLMSQLLLSMKDYSVRGGYVGYLFLALSGLLLAKATGLSILFAAGLVVSNALVATVVLFRWRQLHGN
ncbi:membrane protein of unknown function [Georgfuchsia toluolica]|uniref:Uncharacterized protein n=1 Tax=Georgfuchsia toluolica TaxID=424218 RepID=A0A916N0X6_9PROT|nr:hypothetical protein [Georgfuchsia toluolica]CAG4884363.1 membrane protein of unknown function [Georgfuchsia toluolica]